MRLLALEDLFCDLRDRFGSFDSCNLLPGHLSRRHARDVRTARRRGLPLCKNIERCPASCARAPPARASAGAVAAALLPCAALHCTNTTQHNPMPCVDKKPCSCPLLYGLATEENGARAKSEGAAKLCSPRAVWRRRARFSGRPTLQHDVDCQTHTPSKHLPE